MSGDIGIGKLIVGVHDAKKERDAIHVAVICVEAAMHLQPGDHVSVKIEGDGKYLAAKSGWGVQKVGIVDPFLPREVMRGQKFWLFLYPGTITSLKHHWTHPAFPDVEEPKVVEKIVEKVVYRERDEQYGCSEC